MGTYDNTAVISSLTWSTIDLNWSTANAFTLLGFSIEFELKFIILVCYVTVQRIKIYLSKDIKDIIKRTAFKLQGNCDIAVQVPIVCG